jgi:hypothetical protein
MYAYLSDSPVDNCPYCRGSGWEDGPDEWETIGGQPHRYTTVIPCRHLQPARRDWNTDRAR